MGRVGQTKVKRTAVWGLLSCGSSTGDFGGCPTCRSYTWGSFPLAWAGCRKAIVSAGHAHRDSPQARSPLGLNYYYLSVLLGISYYPHVQQLETPHATHCSLCVSHGTCTRRPCCEYGAGSAGWAPRLLRHRASAYPDTDPNLQLAARAPRRRT